MDVMSDMSCRGCDMDNADRAVGNASANYRDEISVGSGGVGVDDGSWCHCLPIYSVASIIKKNEASALLGVAKDRRNLSHLFFSLLLRLLRKLEIETMMYN